MHPLSKRERRDAIARIAGALDHQKEEAKAAGADMLAFLIAAAHDEARKLLDGAAPTDQK